MVCLIPEEEPRQHILRTCLIGVGGAGGNIVSALYESFASYKMAKPQSFFQNIDFLAINTDAQDLKKLKGVDTLCIGEKVCGGLGAGADPQKGAEAALESVDAIRKRLDNFEFIFIFAGLGGGTGTGATPEVCKALVDQKKSHRLVVVCYIYPFATVRSQRIMSNACIQNTSDRLRSNGGIFLLSNEKYVGYRRRGDREREDTFTDTFEKVNKDIVKLMMVFLETIYIGGTLNLDYSDLVKIVTDGGPILNMSYGIANDDDETPVEVIDNLRKSISFSPVVFSHAKGALINFFNKRFGRDSIREILGDVSVLEHNESIQLNYGINEASEQMKIFMLISTEYSEDLINEWARESDEYSQRIQQEVKSRIQRTHQPKHEHTPQEMSPAFSTLKKPEIAPSGNPDGKFAMYSITEEILDNSMPALTRINKKLRFPKS